MRTMANFAPPVRILLWVMFAISLVVTIFAALIVFGVTLPLDVSPAQASVTLFSSTIVAVFSVLLATIHYHIDEKHLRLKLAFFDILGGRISLQNILNVVIKEGKMYISYIWQGEDPVIAQIAIAPKHFERFKDELIRKNPRIVFFDDDTSVEN